MKLKTQKGFIDVNMWSFMKCVLIVNILFSLMFYTAAFLFGLIIGIFG